MITVGTGTGKADRPPRRTRTSKAQRPSGTVIALGGVPRADLLPPEIRAAQRGKAIARVLGIVVVTVAVIVAGGVGYATVRSVESQAALEAERERSDELLARQLDFAEARQVANRVDAAIEARRLGTTTEIDWTAYLGEVSATLPAGVTLVSLTVSPVAPVDPDAPFENPLQETAVSAITIQAASASVPDVEAWFARLQGITAFAGIAPPAKVEGTADDGYVVSLELLVNEEAYLMRFQDETAP